MLSTARTPVTKFRLPPSMAMPASKLVTLPFLMVTPLRFSR